MVGLPKTVTCVQLAPICTTKGPVLAAAPLKLEYAVDLSDMECKLLWEYTLNLRPAPIAYQDCHPIAAAILDIMQANGSKACYSSADGNNTDQRAEPRASP